MVILVLMLLAGKAGAAELEDALDLDGLEIAAQEYIEGVELDTGTTLDDGLNKIFRSGSEAVAAWYARQSGAECFCLSSYCCAR